MNRSRCSQFGVVISLLVALTASAGVEAAKQPGAIRTGTGPAWRLVIPDLNSLRDITQSRGMSALGLDLRVALSRELAEMSVEHLRVLKAAGGQVTTEAKAEDWVAQRAPGRGIPDKDRAIIAGILLQTDLLDAALERRDSNAVEALRRARASKASRGKKDTIFGDRRDHIFLVCMNELNTIAALQEALGGESAKDWYSPQSHSPKEAEACLLEGVTRLAQRARQIP